MDFMLIFFSFTPNFQLQRIPKSERILRNRDGIEQCGGVATVAHVGETAVEISKIVHRIWVGDRSEPESQSV